jgi:hypothetical protein
MKLKISLFSDKDKFLKENNLNQSYPRSSKNRRISCKLPAIRLVVQSSFVISNLISFKPWRIPVLSSQLFCKLLCSCMPFLTTFSLLQNSLPQFYVEVSDTFSQIWGSAQMLLSFLTVTAKPTI